MNLLQPGWTDTAKRSIRPRRRILRLLVAPVLFGAICFWRTAPATAQPGPQANKTIGLKFLGRASSGIFGPDASGAESLSHDPQTQRVFVVNVAKASIDVIDIHNPADPKFLFAIDLTSFGANANSVAVLNGVVAVAVQANIKTDPGMAVFLDANGVLLNAVQVGALPDMITFTPNGRRVLVANEGEPNDDYTVDPEGSVSIIDLPDDIRQLNQTHVRTATFTKFNNTKLDPSIRVFGPNATVAKDLEPEYITVSQDSRIAWVTLQEANAIAELNIDAGEFTALRGLGFKDHLIAGKGLDVSDQDGRIAIRNWPVLGMYQPDAIAGYNFKGRTYLVTANEGDSRDYSGFSEESRFRALSGAIPPCADSPRLKAFFANNTMGITTLAQLRDNANGMGRLTVTTKTGLRADGTCYEDIYVFGARSFSIWDEQSKQIFDSGDAFEQIIADRLPNNFNADNAANNFDNRSDNKGPEPEGVAIARLFGNVYAFIVLERIGGVMIYDITNPFDVAFVDYLNTRDFSVPVCDQANDDDCEQGSFPNPAVGDLGPEVVHVIAAEDSPTGAPLLAVANEISGTAALFEIVKQSQAVVATK